MAGRWFLALRRSAIRAAVALTVLLGLVFLAGEIYRRRDASDALLAARDTLAHAELQPIESPGPSSLHELRLRGERGLVVDGWLRLPATSGPHPAIVILGGLRTGRRAVGYLREDHPIALLALDYPYPSERKPKGLVQCIGEAPRIHQAVFETVPAVMLAIDYLTSREDIDPRRIVLVGGSLGALFAPAAAALDPRVTAVALLFGAGDLGALAEVNLKWPWPARKIGGWCTGVIAAPLEPLEHIGAISPRPLLLVQATGDKRMPEILSRRLEQQAGEPLSVRRLEIGHVNIRDPRFHAEVLEEVMSWLAEIRVTSD